MTILSCCFSNWLRTSYLHAPLSSWSFIIFSTQTFFGDGSLPPIAVHGNKRKRKGSGSLSIPFFLSYETAFQGSLEHDGIPKCNGCKQRCRRWFGVFIFRCCCFICCVALRPEQKGRERLLGKRRERYLWVMLVQSGVQSGCMAI